MQVSRVEGLWCIQISQIPSGPGTRRTPGLDDSTDVFWLPARLCRVNTAVKNSGRVRYEWADKSSHDASSRKFTNQDFRHKIWCGLRVE